MSEAASLAILIASGLVVITAFTSLIAFRVGSPLLLVFLAVGLLAGEDGIGGIAFDNAQAAYFIGSVALAIILFDSGATTRRHSFRVAAAPAIVLATLGVILTAALVAVPTRVFLGLGWMEALLLGAIVGSTDAAAVFFLLRIGGIQIRERIRATLEVESASNDPMAIFLTITLVELMAAGAGGQPGLSWGVLRLLALQFGLGIVLGLGFGWAMVQGLNRVNLEAGLYPIVVLALALCVFSFTSLVGGSGFLAAYVAGLVVGNMELRGGLAFRKFQEGLTWLAQITMFLVLGLLATPSQFPAIVWPAVMIALALIFVARPIAVWLCLAPFGFHRNETTFIAWVGLRGAVSILLGILPVIGGLDPGQLLFNSAFIVVLVSLLVQGWTIRPMARWLGLIVPPPIGAVEKVELELPGNARHELVAYRVATDSPVAKGERVPRWARPSLVVREGRSMRVHDAGRLQAGDYVYIFTLPRLIRLLDRLFASEVPLTERQREYFGEFPVDPEQPIEGLARAYGFELPAGEGPLTVGEVLRRRLGPTIGRGDRLLLGPVELVVREADDNRLSVGLEIEPSVATPPRLPLFQNFQEIVAVLRARLGRSRTPPGGS